eukprot:7148360-Karenia_brevis.AAC.1
MSDATQEGPKDDPTVKAHNGDGTSGYEDEDMHDDHHSCPSLEPPSDDDAPPKAPVNDPLAAMCSDSPWSGYTGTSSTSRSQVEGRTQ